MVSCVADWAMILQYVKVFAAWPFLTFAFAIILLWSLSANQVRGFGARLWRRVTKIGPSGVELGPDVPRQEPPSASPNNLATEPVAQLPEVVRNERDSLEAHLRNENLPNEAAKISRLLTWAAYSRVWLQFERLAAMIFKSQLDFLRELSAPGTIDRQRAVVFYDQGKSRTPEYYQRYAFDNWLDFLQQWRLVEVSHGTVSITETGREFLRALIQTNRPEPTLG